ncbi:DUF6049 family protein [Nonomuraea sp. NPDC050663]|uniref:DUF6049 family protein n=1 Tax=Nonomuraea sp. NPDC050663 TaxID=3364370 RepID=UPI0037B84327
MIRKLTLLALSLAALMTTTVVVAPPGAAARAETKLWVKAFTPDVPTSPTTPITISGTLTNRGTTPLQGTQIRLRTSNQRFTGRAELESYQSGQLVSRDVAWTAGSVTLSAPVEPGATVSWQTQITPAQLTLSQFGVYPLSIQAFDSWSGTEIDIWRSFLTYAPANAPKLPKTKLAFALPIIDEPHRSDKTTFTDDELRTSITDKGRLGRLLKLAQTAPKTATWFVEPGILDDVQSMADTYSVLVKGNPESKAGAPEATAWLNSLSAALAGVPVVAVPYSDPDLVALAHNGLDKQTGVAIETGAASAASLLKRSDISTTANWPAAGLLDADALDVLSIAKVDTVLLSPENLPASQQLLTTPDAAATLDTVGGSVTALVPDPVLSHTLEPDTAVAGSTLAAKHRFIAETAIIASETPATAKSLVVAPTRRWDPNAAHVTALMKAASSLPWLAMSPLDSIEPVRNSPPRGPLTYTDANASTELGKAYLDQVKQVAHDAQLTAQVTTSLKFSGFETSILRLTSAGWRKRLRAAESARKTVAKGVAGKLDDVLVPSVDRPRALAGNNGWVPISVTNGTPNDIALRLVVTADKTDELSIGDYPDELNIGAGQSGTIQVPMEVKTAADTTVSVQLQTRDGLAYGSPYKLTIRTTGYTGIALVIVGAALVVMLAAVVMRVLRRRSQKRVEKAGRSREAERV